jgi:hypothetical protein
MLKKLIFIFAILLFIVGPAFADVDEILGISTVDEYLGIGTVDEFLGQGIASGEAPSCDDCSGARTFAWHMENVDVTLGTPCGCSDADTIADGSGDIDFVDAAPAPFDGTYSLCWLGALDYAYFTLSGTINPENFSVTILVNMVDGTFDSGTEIFELYGDTNDYINLQITGAEDALDVQGKVSANGTSYYIANNADRADSEWFCVVYKVKFDEEGNDHSLSVCDSDCASNCVTNTEDDDIVANFDTTPTVMIFGNQSANTGSGCVDAVDIGVSGL